MSDLHVHFHGEVAAGATLVIQVPQTGTIGAQLNQLKELITMNQQELDAALGGVITALGDVSAQLDKGISEVVLALQNSGNTSPEVDAKVAALGGIATALKAATQTLDDMNTDTPAVP